MTVHWDIRRRGRAWVGNEMRARVELLPEKFEVIDGRLLWSERERIAMLGVMLEQVGIDKAIRLGDPARWRAAISELPG
ncbi:MAG TPA: hypothetical protein VFW98_07270 [Gemmatimonadaceae bacterium]|nr:hypothetical protein [Gemmatimonadaceae bacterium]